MKGQLLVAGADLFDPNFRRTVVLVTEHNDEGALGLVLNRPAEATVDEALGFVRGDADIALAAASTRRARVFAGYAGWGAGQLDAELEANGWIIAPARREDVFAEGDGELWSEVVRRQGGRYFKLLATMPLDPSQN